MRQWLHRKALWGDSSTGISAIPHLEMPVAALFADAAWNPKFVAEYVFPAAIFGFYTHLEYIKLVP
jgi:hypothetical protein